jgi:hypothetical protein
MLKWIVTMPAIALLISCSMQQSIEKHEFEIIQLEEYYEGQGAIIPATSPSYFVGHQVKEKITPTLEQVRKAEHILKEGLFNSYEEDLNRGKIYFYSADNARTREDSLRLLLEMVKNVRKEMRSYYRQYLGYISDRNEEMIVIYLFNYGTREARDHFRNWQNEYCWGSGEFYDNNTFRFLINLATGAIEN